ncbi:MAG: hypothetical protein ACR2L0_00340 [Gaiellaceae bacterium]
MSALARSPRTSPLVFGALMSLWIGAVANSQAEPPGLVVAALFLVPLVLHVWLGWVVAQWWALGLAALPVVAAVVAGGLGSALWIVVVLLELFPGALLIAAGVYARLRQEERENPADDHLWSF